MPVIDLPETGLRNGLQTMWGCEDTRGFKRARKGTCVDGVKLVLLEPFSEARNLSLTFRRQIDIRGASEAIFFCQLGCPMANELNASRHS